MGGWPAGDVAAELRSRVRGDVIGPADRGYDRFRAVFNARVDHRPAAVVRCASRADIAAALAVRADRGLPFSVRAGGGSDRAVADGGIVADVRPLKRVMIDPQARTARVGAGLTWAEMDAATQEYGLAVTGARVSGLGVAGVTLGGGSGWLERLLGPTCASLTGAEVVLADGSVVTATEAENPGLLWALRGGGGNFGVVTELEFRLHPVGPDLLCGFLTYPRSQALQIARRYRDYIENAPAQAGGGLVLFPGRAGTFSVIFCYAGPAAEGEQAVAPLRALGPSLNAVTGNSYRAFQAMTDLQNPAGMRAYLRRGYLAELSDQALECAVAAASQPASSLCQVLLTPLGGAMTRLEDTALSLRVPGTGWAYQCLSLWPPLPELDDGNISWARSFADAMRPFAAAAPAAPAIASSPDPGQHSPELQRLKRRYDPDGVFLADPAPGPPALRQARP
ncbi:MAG: FAD-binding oxidoreductase [Actinobacteria bacterium]|nr:FAD-binding oxidoreductase [Actinomycetota bacterium]